jgi:DNA-binding transcriptional MerR regulator/methylmalonyl-CoA mutase cobalamin-binding subunit
MDNNDLVIDASELERETGLSKDLLRKWRSRYGFPKPLSGALGESGYSKEQIAQLHLIRRLMNAGFRPVQVVGKTLAELERLVEAMGCGPDCSAEPPFIKQVCDLLKQFDLNGLERLLDQTRKHQSLTEFVEQTIAPLVVGVGEAWARGQIEVCHEHLCTSMLTRRLHAEIGAARPKPGYPRILFATPSDELHVLGLLMAQAVLSDQGAECIDIGPHIPPGDLERAIVGCKADIVALSFSFAYPKWRVRPMLLQLRERLPVAVEIWAGGAGAACIKRTPKGVRIFSDLNEPVIALQHLQEHATRPQGQRGAS